MEGQRLEVERDGFIVSTDSARLDLDLIHDFLSNHSYWAKGITFKKVLQAIDGSFCFGVYTAEGAQVGFARVITDYTSYAWMCDVFIIEAYRGRGLGKWLIGTVLNHPDLQGLRRWALATRDAQGLYARYGFQPLARPDGMMERVQHDQAHKP